MGIRIRKVDSRDGLNRFIRFPHLLYTGNPFWVPPLDFSERNTLSARKNPAFDFCDTSLFLAYRNGNIVGRIAAIINHIENEKTDVKHGRFGWFDFIDDKEVSQSLIETVESWVREKDCKILKGPYGFNNLDKAGVLSHGYDQLGTMATSYNYPYYIEHIEDFGYEKWAGWNEFEAIVPDSLPERVTKMSRLVKEKYNLREVRFSNRKSYTILGRKVFSLMNQAYNHLEGFIPFTPPIIDKLIAKYLRFINPNYICFVSDDSDEIVGMGISMPSFSKALQKCHGKIFPFGFIHMKRSMRRNDTADLYLIAVRPDYKNKGITSIIFEKIIKTFIANQIKRVETNPEMESNQQVQNLWKGYEVKLHKKRNSYAKHL
jgi:ribosomal protein S18 acetylase RimI-like enzyme